MLKIIFSPVVASQNHTPSLVKLEALVQLEYHGTENVKIEEFIRVNYYL